ncbi:MAG: biotin--[acetyl-CoA-carboxylase] ligase, partial [Rhodospirillaceae bacterium]
AQLSFVAAVGLYDALGNVSPAGHQLHLKWPNDVLLQEKKVAGLLLESEGAGGDAPPDFVIVGLGLNVEHFPDDARYPATSLRFEHWTTSVEEALEAFARSFLVWANRWVDEGFEPIRRTWLQRCIGLGDAIEVRLETETRHGIFRDMDETGALVLERDGGTERIAAGDVYFPAT